MARRLFRPLFCALLLAVVARGADTPLSAYDRVVVEPVKTSIYIGSVTMTTPPFVRKNGVYEASYAAKVVPFFFSSERGTMAVTISDENLRKLEKGETVEFSGRAVNTDGEERRVEAKAMPADATSGRLKVRVFVSKRIELIFNTSYRFEKL